MNRSAMVWALFAVSLDAMNYALAQNASIPALAEEPGQSSVRAPDASYGAESIDPFTGALKIVATDLVVPSNGGLDISITRNYVSMQIPGAAMPGYMTGRTTTGIGWDIHFGRVWRASATQGYTLPAGISCAATSGSGNDSQYNPVLELPDGSRQVLVTANVGKPYKFITRDQWIGRCLPTSADLGNGGLEVISPQGIKYTFNRLGRVAAGSADNSFAYHPTRIEHPNGTALTLEYVPIGSDPFLRLASITHSEGQTVTFEYLDPTSVNARLHKITASNPTRIWTYDYVSATDPVLGGMVFHYLTKVTRPDGESYDYDYYTSALDVGRYSLKSLTTPLKAKVTYTYRSQLFPRHIGAVDPSNSTIRPIIVVSSKEITGFVDATGAWTYTYEPADTATEITDITRVDGPTNCVVYEHQAATEANGQLWRIGLLLNKWIRSSCNGSTLRHEQYTWMDLPISEQNYWSWPGISDVRTNAPVLDTVAVTQDGTTYTTDYSDYDEYGNALKVVESGQDSRTIDRTFLTDTTRWIVKTLKNEEVNSAGTIYTSPTTPMVSDYSIVRTFYDTGDLESESREGVTTDYVWHTSGSSRGGLHTVTDANQKAITYTNYKRGTPQNEAHPLGVSLSRTVNGSGTIATQTDARNRVTSYTYDLVNELTGITTPKTTDDNTSIERGDPDEQPPIGSTESKRKRTLLRGTYKEVRVYDGLGKLRQIKLTDRGTGRLINKQFRLDAEGRIQRSYLPSHTTSSDYDAMTYDALGRLRTVTHPDGSQLTYDYLSGNRVRITNERGFTTAHTYRSYGSPDERELVKIESQAGLTPSDTATTVTTDIARNKIGQVTAITQGGVTRTYRYDTRFFLTYEIDPELGTITYGRDAAGNLTSKKVGGSGTTIYTLDDLYRVDLITYPGTTTPAIDYDYYSDGSLKYVIKGNTRWDYTYDDNNNLATETATFAALTLPLVYSFDSRDALSSIQYPSGLVVSYVPNAFGQPTAVSSGLGSHVSNINYFPNGQLDSFTLANGYTTDYGQNNRLFPTTLRSFATRNGASVDLINLVHQYDFAGNTEYIYDYRAGSSNRSMIYDGLNRLRNAVGSFGSGSFTYDGRNNLLTKSFPYSSLGYNYDTSTGRLTSITQAGGGTMSLGYDVYGNITANGRNQLGYGMFAYDEASNLVQVGSPARISYSYDGNNRMAIETRVDGSSTRYSLYNRADKRLYDFDTVNSEAIDYIYLGTALVANRSRCTSSVDSDGDGLPNCYEWRSGMSPQNPSDAATDTDGDQLSNLLEYQAGTNLYVADTDGDGLGDGYERRHGLNALVADSNLDTDGDTLTNLQEFQLGTRPDRVDTDGDGIPDNLDPKPRFNPAVLMPIIQMILE